MARSKSTRRSSKGSSTASGRRTKKVRGGGSGWSPVGMLGGLFASLRSGRSVRFMVVGLWTAGIVGIAGAWAYWLPSLRAYAADRVAERVVEVHLPPFPAWLDLDHPTDANLPPEVRRDLDIVKSQIIDEIVAAARSEIGPDLFEWEDLDHARRALERTGWFRTVDRVERIADDVVRISGQYVVPYTMVQDGAGNHLVTRSARLLPLRYPRNVRLKRMPLIVGARFARPQYSGEVWKGRDIEAGLRLIEKLIDAPWADQIAEIDVGEFSHTESLWINTVHGARILWGRAPGEERGIEVPARQKYMYLDALHKTNGRISGIYSDIDLTTDVVYTR